MTLLLLVVVSLLSRNMKSHKAELVRLEFLLDDIQKLDDLIAMHRSIGNDFMYSQYEAKKLDQFKKLLILLADSRLNTAQPQTFHLIPPLIQRFYPQAEHLASTSPLLQSITCLLQQFLTKSPGAAYPLPVEAARMLREDGGELGEQ